MMYGNIDLNCNIPKYIHSETSFNHILKFAWKTRCGTIIKINWIPRHLPRAFHSAHCDARALNRQMQLVGRAWNGPQAASVAFSDFQLHGAVSAAVLCLQELREEVLASQTGLRQLPYLDGSIPFFRSMSEAHPHDLRSRRWNLLPALLQLGKGLWCTGFGRTLPLCNNIMEAAPLSFSSCTIAFSKAESVLAEVRRCAIHTLCIGM